MDSERGSVRYCLKKIKAANNIPEAKWTGRLRFRIYYLVSLSGLKFKAPTAVSHPANNLKLREVSEQWKDLREELSQFIQGYPKAYERKAIYRHPIAGRIRLDEMLLFFDAHMKHHEHQIDRILNAVG